MEPQKIEATLKYIKELSEDIHTMKQGKFGSHKKALELQKLQLKRKGLQSKLPPLKLVIIK
jgi:hypothetical protein